MDKVPFITKGFIQAFGELIFFSGFLIKIWFSNLEYLKEFSTKSILHKNKN
jgi:hypothetical protein